MFLSPIFAEEEEEKNGRAREERRKPKEKEKGLKRLGLAWWERVASSFWKAKRVFVGTLSDVFKEPAHVLRLVQCLAAT